MTTQLIQSIGWTLIHSLWQGLAIFILLKVAVRLTNRSDVRYAMGVGAMGLSVLVSLITFAMLTDSSASNGFQFFLAATTASAAKVETTSFIQTVSQYINQNIIWLLRFWMFGFAVGLLRIAAGLWYINRLRNNANPVGDEWMKVVNRLSESLNVSAVVTMAEARISSPMVVGLVKPMILFPAGLLSGLSVEQVETILVHELSHIRRQDYIINLVQSVIETIYFFNPFVLLMSSLIREERENCCDDMVIAKGVNPISYVKTLAQLEASRTTSKLALGLIKDQNQLLNRIKRIMEKSAKNDWGKSRFVPIALLALGLICASWLSIGTEAEAQVKQEKLTTKYKAAQNDTSREDGLIVIKRGRGVDAWAVAPVPPVPDMTEVPEVPEVPEIDFDRPDISEFDFHGFDSIPAYQFRFREPIDFEEFEKEFTEKFQAEFGDFYKKNQEQINKMMSEIKRSEEGKRREAAEIVDMAQFQRNMAVEAEIMANQARISSEMHKQQFDVMREQLLEQEIMVKDMELRANEYNEELIKMLKNDGYVSKDDPMNNININSNNGDLVINGHKIKEKDKLKYQALHDKYFERFNKQPSNRRSE